MRAITGDISRNASRPFDAGPLLDAPMQAFLRATLPLIVVAGTFAFVAGSTYGVISAQHWTRMSGSTPMTDSPMGALDSDAVVPPPSWRRWWPLTDF